MNAGRPMQDYDRLCVQSWIASGFRVLAINDREEIPALAARHPEIAFVPAERDARALFGRNTPFIAEMMSILARQPEPVLGIINSDLLFEPVSAWQTLAPIIARKTVATGQRYDTRMLAGGALHRYLPGFDYFFFDHGAANALAETILPFCIGLPWWDYWCPLSLALKGYDVRCVARPVVLHLGHESGAARSAPWRQLALAFARSILRDWDAGEHVLPDLQSLIAFCRELAAEPAAAMEAGSLDDRIVHLVELAVPAIARNVTELDEAAPLPVRETSIPPLFFENIPNRIAAGQALHQALWEEKQGRSDEAHRLYVAALGLAPQDPGVLSACGNHLRHRGDLGPAAHLLSKAVELLPDSATLLNSLGSVLGQLGRDDAAIGCFERALQADPLDGTSYYNLAMALYPRNRHGEIISRLEARLRDAPNFPDGTNWLRRIRATLSELSAPPAGTRRPSNRGVGGS
jgi:tetratricopeptide (TPR) repeat protein